jgi:hypothetical protein
MAGRRLPGAAGRKVQIFCLPGFVEDPFARAVCRAASFMSATHLLLVLDHEELSHLSEHMYFRNTDADRTCTRKEGDTEVRNRNAFCGPTFFDLKVLGQIFLVDLEAALNPGR